MKFHQVFIKHGTAKIPFYVLIPDVDDQETLKISGCTLGWRDIKCMDKPSWNWTGSITDLRRQWYGKDLAGFEQNFDRGLKDSVYIDKFHFLGFVKICLGKIKQEQETFDLEDVEKEYEAMKEAKIRPKRCFVCDLPLHESSNAIIDLNKKKTFCSRECRNKHSSKFVFYFI